MADKDMLLQYIIRAKDEASVNLQKITGDVNSAIDNPVVTYGPTCAVHLAAALITTGQYEHGLLPIAVKPNMPT